MRIFLLLLSCLPVLGMAHNLKISSPPPSVSVADKGELAWQNQHFSYQNWSSSQLTGKVRIIQHIAGRTSAKEMNAELIEAIKAAHFPHDQYQTTTIINLDDVLFGTGAFVQSSAKDGKQAFPWSSVVLDANGRVRQAWALAEKSSAILLLDKQGQIRFAKEGQLTHEELTQVLTEIRRQLK